jgi:uncharacterized protein
MDRRAFLARTAAVAGGTVAGSEALMRLANRAALADLRATGGGYGPLTPMPDQNGRVVLALPDGFSYVTFGDIGSPLSDGTPTPLALDGMAAFKGPRGTVRLARPRSTTTRAADASCAASSRSTARPSTAQVASGSAPAAG